MQENIWIYILINLFLGGLHKPAFSVIKVCKRTEMDLRQILVTTGNRIPKEDNFFSVFVTCTAQKFYEKGLDLFPSLQNHNLEKAPDEECHVYILLKEIVFCYSKIRIHNLLKKFTLSIQGPSVRRQLNKLILFHNQ